MESNRGDPLHLEPAIRHIECLPFMGMGPKTTKVTYEGIAKDGKPVKVTHKRSELGSQPDSVKKKSIRVSSTITTI